MLNEMGLRLFVDKKMNFVIRYFVYTSIYGSCISPFLDILSKHDMLYFNEDNILPMNKTYLM